MNEAKKPQLFDMVAVLGIATLPVKDVPVLNRYRTHVG